MTADERLREAATRLRYPYRDSRRYDEPLADWLDVTADVHEAGYHDAPPAALADLIRARDAEVRADERAKVRYVVFSSDWIEPPGDVIAVFATKAEAMAHIDGPGDGYGWSVVEVPAP